MEKIKKALQYKITKCCTLSVLLLSPLLSAANNTMHYHSLTDIKQKVHAFVLDRLSGEASRSDFNINIGLIDPRLRFNQCLSALDLTLPHGIKGGNATIAVRCNTSTPWSLYVPVIIQRFKSIIVSSHPLQRGAIITARDLSMQRHNIYNFPAGYVEKKERLIGKVVLQNLPAGAILNMRQIDLPIAIRRGQLVSLKIKNRSIEVRSTAKALEDGAIGDRIKLKNTKSDRVVEGIIINKQLVSIRK